MKNKKHKLKTKNIVEFRKDIVSGEWILVSSGSNKKPVFFTGIVSKPYPRSECPFENPISSGNEKLLLWYPSPGKNKIEDWWVLIFPNKYPVVASSNVCPQNEKSGIYEKKYGVGFQEVVVTRDHNRSIAQMTESEIELLLEAYLSRFQALRSEECVEYILIIHNHGSMAGASIPHPHSQMFAIPLVPPDVAQSIMGSRKYFDKYHKCVHCSMISCDLKEKKRIIFENKLFIVVAPYAPRASFEVRIYPKIHESRFEVIDFAQKKELAEAMKNIF